MSYFFEHYDDAFLFAYGHDMKQTIKRMNQFCKATNISPWKPVGTDSDKPEDVRRIFVKLIESIRENGLPSFLIVKSEDSILLGFKEIDELSELIDSGLIAVWCLDEHTLLVNPEKTF